MAHKKKYYFGNYPNSYGYDPNITIGYNQWDDDNYADETENDTESEENILDEESVENKNGIK